MTTTRRTFLLSTSRIALSGGAAAALAGPLSTLALAQAPADADPAELMVPGPLGEAAIGAEDAPVTIVEYASLTCSHCATFHNQVFPDLKQKYVDTGKVRFVFREFPLDPLAYIAFMVSRCLDKGQYLPFVDLLFKNQQQWTRTNDPLGQLLLLAKQAGMSEETFDKCVQNQQLLDGVKWVYDRAAEKFGVASTPTFFVNGKIVRGVQSLEEFDKLIEPHLRS